MPLNTFRVEDKKPCADRLFTSADDTNGINDDLYQENEMFNYINGWLAQSTIEEQALLREADRPIFGCPFDIGSNLNHDDRFV